MLKRIPLTDELIANYDVLPLGTKGEIAAVVSSWLDSDEDVSDVFHHVTPAQVSAFRKALADLHASDTVSIQTLTSVTGSRTFTVKRTRKDGTPISYDVTRETRSRYGIFLQRENA